LGIEKMQITTNYFDNVGNIDSLTNTTPSGNASFQYDAFNRLTKATYPEKIYDYAYAPFGNMLTAQENSLTVFSKTYTAANRVSSLSYDGRGNLIQGDGLTQVWDKRNRLTESRTSTNALLGTYVYNERGLRVKAERYGLRTVQVVSPNGGESLYLGAMDTVNWNSMGVTGTLKLELLVNGSVAGTIADGLPAGQTSYQWQVGKTLTGWVNPGADFKLRVSSIVPPMETGATYYFYDSGGKLLAEYDGSGACVKDYLYLGGKMVGEFVPSSGSYYYYASDQINSTRLVTDATGAVVHSAQYDPYGGLYKIWIDIYHPKPGFSGKERELYSDLDYFGARYYGHKQYRFLSIDPIIKKNESLINPQLWNLYAYCGNNPIGFVDPDGRETLGSLGLKFDYLNEKNKTDPFSNIDYSGIDNWAFKKSATLSLDVLAVVTSFYAASTGNKAAEKASIGLDVMNAYLNKDIGALSPEIAQVGSRVASNISNAGRRLAGGAAGVNAKKVGGWAGFITSVAILVRDIKELFK
jgi:RHS repeat-associated protein